MGSTRRIAALIFDFDGLIVDSESPGFQAWSEVFEAHGCLLPFEKYAACIGTIDGFDLHAYLESQSGRRFDRDELESKCDARWRELMASQVLLPGVASCVASARARGLKLAVASSSTEDWVVGNLRRFDLHSSFDAICTRELVPAVKPDPALYIAALRHLELDASQAVAIEDSPNGVLAAKRAGLYCVAVPNSLTRMLPLDLADRTIASLEELDVDAL